MSCEHLDDLSVPCPWPGCPAGTTAEKLTLSRGLGPSFGLGGVLRTEPVTTYCRVRYEDEYGGGFAWEEER